MNCRTLKGALVIAIVGLGAVLVPHARTWVLEHQDLRTPAGGRFLQVERFADLRKHF